MPGAIRRVFLVGRALRCAPNVGRMAAFPLPARSGVRALPSRKTRRCLLLLLAALCLSPQAAQAYLGPGAGFTIVSTFFVLFAAIASAFVVLLTWPFRWVL